MFSYKKKKKTRPPKKHVFLLNQGSAAFADIAAQFYHRSRRQRPKMTKALCSAVARSQKFAMWGCFGGLGAEPPAAGGHVGEDPSRWGFGGKALSRRRHGGLGAEPPALKTFAFFCKNNLILGLF